MSDPITVYGIPNCDTCRKARQWLAGAGVEHTFVDVRREPPTSERLAAWRSALGDTTLINKRSKTWRDFDDTTKCATEADPLPVLAEHPTLIKRPILETPTATLAGFSAARYEAVIAGAD